jgi:hypothetical protein
MMRKRLITLFLTGAFVVPWLAGGAIQTAGGTAEGCIYSDPRHDQQVSSGPFGLP